MITGLFSKKKIALNLKLFWSYKILSIKMKIIYGNKVWIPKGVCTMLWTNLSCLYFFNKNAQKKNKRLKITKYLWEYNRATKNVIFSFLLERGFRIPFVTIYLGIVTFVRPLGLITL